MLPHRIHVSRFTFHVLRLRLSPDTRRDTFPSMVLEFTKMNGAGNDFVLIDNREQKIGLTRDQIVRVCDRHRGVGADGIILLVPCVSRKADWAWQFFNSDGSTGEMCG